MSDETAAALEGHAKQMPRIVQIQKAQIDLAEAMHPSSCEDPCCPAIQAIASGRENLDQLVTLDRFFSDLIGSLKCASVTK